MKAYFPLFPIQVLKNPERPFAFHVWNLCKWTTLVWGTLTRKGKAPLNSQRAPFAFWLVKMSQHSRRKPKQQAGVLFYSFPTRKLIVVFKDLKHLTCPPKPSKPLGNQNLFKRFFHGIPEPAPMQRNAWEGKKR